MTKFTKRHAKQVTEFMSKMDSDGCVTVDQWTSGSGRYTTNKALPPFVARYSKSDFKLHDRTSWPQHGTAARAACDFFRKTENAKRKAVLVLDINAWHEFVMDGLQGKEF